MAILLALAAFVGWLSGWLISKVFRRERTPLTDMLFGIVGFCVGTFVSLIGFSYRADWYDGKLVSRHVGGLADHFLLIATACSITAVVIVKAGAYLWTLRLAKRR